jgi:hypothetical protein
MTGATSRWRRWGRRTPLRPTHPVASWSAGPRAGVGRVDVDPPRLPPNACPATVPPVAVGADASFSGSRAGVRQVDVDPPPPPSKVYPATVPPAYVGVVAAAPGEGMATDVCCTTGLPPVETRDGYVSIASAVPARPAATNGWCTVGEVHPTSRELELAALGEDGVGVDPPQGPGCTTGGVKRSTLPTSTTRQPLRGQGWFRVPSTRCR